jgi:outer membrane protein assembly complex protein YaeT
MYRWVVRLILNSASASNRSRHILRILLLLISLSWVQAPAIAFPYEWDILDSTTFDSTIPNRAMSDSEKQLLQIRVATIRSSMDIAILIAEIGQQFPSSSISAFLRDGKVWFNIRPAIIVSDIPVTLVTRTYQRDLRQISDQWLGQAHTPDLESKIRTNFLTFLYKKGFPKATVSIEREPISAFEMRLLLSIDEGRPCKIETVAFLNKDPFTAELPNFEGSLCNLDRIDSISTTLKNLYDENGYFQSRVSKPTITFSKNDSRATVQIRNEKGLKIIYETAIKDEDFTLRKIFSNEVINKDDANSIDPNAMISELTKRYQNQGFADVVVERPDIVNQNADTYLYRFPVTLGPRYMIAHVKFEGLTAYTESQALEFMGLKGLWQESSVLIPENINTALDKLRDQYQADGYWDAKVRYPNVGKDAATAQATVTFRVSEGKPRKFGKMILEGNLGIPNEQISDLFTPAKEEALSQSDLVSFEERLIKHYMENGYAFASVQLEPVATVNRNDITIDLQVNIDEYKRTRIGNISIIGLRITESKIVTRELLFQSGDWYDPIKFAATKRALLRLGIFRSVAILSADRKSIRTPVESLDIAIEVVEAEPGSGSFGPGYSWPEGMHYTGEISYSNLWGQAKKTSARLSLSEQRHQGAISNKTLLGRKFTTGFLYPYIFGLPVDAMTTLNHRAIIAEQNIALWQIQNSGEIDFQYRFREWLYDASISFFYGQSVNQEEGIDEDKIYLISTGDSRIGYAGTRFSIDKRNEITWPSEGYSLETEYKMARFPYGGNIKFDKFEAFLAKFISLTDNTALMLGLNLGSFHNISWKGPFPDILPVSERFTAGGIGSVRGFSPGKLGPYISHPSLDSEGSDIAGSTEEKVTGGSQKTVLKFEYRYRLQDSWAVSAFVDSGAIFLSSKEMEQYNKSFRQIHQQRHPDDADALPPANIEENLSYELRDVLKNPSTLWDKQSTAIGPSLSLLLPIGSMNLACGFPIHIAKSDRCRAQGSNCIERASENQDWYNNYTCGLNVGARF